jgi:ATPase subunit of ABC transporter with duplicated ATPase domains
VSSEQRAESREQRAVSSEQRAESREQRAESREKRAESRKQRAENREKAYYESRAIISIVVQTHTVQVKRGVTRVFQGFQLCMHLTDCSFALGPALGRMMVVLVAGVAVASVVVVAVVAVAAVVVMRAMNR